MDVAQGQLFVSMSFPRRCLRLCRRVSARPSEIGWPCPHWSTEPMPMSLKLEVMQLMNIWGA